MTKREWRQTICLPMGIAAACQKDTDAGWTVFGIVHMNTVSDGAQMGDGAVVVSWKDEPDLTGGVPR